MSKWRAIVVRKQYWIVEVEANNWEEAHRLALDEDVDINYPDDLDWDVYDIEEQA